MEVGTSSLLWKKQWKFLIEDIIHEVLKFYKDLLVLLEFSEKQDSFFLLYFLTFTSVTFLALIGAPILAIEIK